MTIQDRSGVITTGGTQQNALSVNRARKFLYIGNPKAETETLYVNFDTAATGGSPSIPIEPGDYLAFQSPSCPVNAVNVYAATTGHKFTIKTGQ